MRTIAGRLDDICSDLVATRSPEYLASRLCRLLLEFAEWNSGTLELHQFSSIAQRHKGEATYSEKEDTLEKHDSLPEFWHVIRLVSTTNISKIWQKVLRSKGSFWPVPDGG
jgi:hypothetical protein